MDKADYGDIIPSMEYFICRYCTPDWNMPESVIDFIDLTYVFEGEVTYTINGISYKAEQGDLICIPQNSLRHAEINPNNPMAAYASNILVVNQKGEDVTIPFPVISKVGINNELLSLYNELNTEWVQKKPCYLMKVRALFLNILYKFFSIIYYKNSYEMIDLRIKKALNYIHDNYYKPMEVTELAELVELNASYFGTLFKKSTGLTTRQYINQIRIDHAENMLSSGEYLIEEVAQKCGFEDSFYFSKVFKKIKNYSPSKVLIK